jgi:uncharacterized damage-inducible protein DinB/predicted RNase H-like HicB family nuclease
MVHVPELLGCMANGPTTGEALARTPQAIRDYLSFLQRHGARHGPRQRAEVDTDAEVRTEIAEHITEGIWLGNGDPSLVFQPDLEPLTEEDAEAYIQRLEWMRSELQDLVGGLSQAQLEEKPLPKGRPIQAILEHILESEVAYMAAFGKLEGLPGPGSIVKKREGDLLDWMGYVRAREIERLGSLSWQERSEPFIFWKYTRTARKVMRRMLEHQWEHLVELKERLGDPINKTT